MPHSHRTYWLQAGAAILLILTFSACTRSASTALTPLPSAPPPTPTSIPDNVTPPPTEPAVATETAVATEIETEDTVAATSQPATAPSTTKSPQVVTATATKASPATTAACGNVLPSRLQVNSYAYVNPDPPLPNNLRSEAGPDNELLGDIQPGQAMKVMAGPKCVDGNLWWQVSPLETDLTGWTAEGDDQTYWLIPCASEQECGTE
ncbi:MAG TPA: hypothetical protein VHP14_01840 [Anaerolineales bacterium]|nr:hypothetical protein [Anaerolineales bacterium]